MLPLPPIDRRLLLQSAAAALGGTSFSGRNDALASQKTRPQRSPPAPRDRTPRQYQDLRLAGDPRIATQARLILEQGSRPRRCLVLLHGLGETKAPALGLKAWSHLYGLLDAQKRLLAAPILRDPKLSYLTQSHVAQLNHSLRKQPYTPMALLCPVTPRPSAFKDRRSMYTDFAHWLVDTLLPAVEARLPGSTTRVGLDGCSMGGSVAAEVFSRQAARFSSFGMVQGAMSNARVPHYLQLLSLAHERSPQARLHLQTSTRDPFRAANVRLYEELSKKHLPADLEVFPGPHNQPWLREIGTLAMLRWHDLHL